MIILFYLHSFRRLLVWSYKRLHALPFFPTVWQLILTNWYVQLGRACHALCRHTVSAHTQPWTALSSVLRSRYQSQNTVSHSTTTVWPLQHGTADGCAIFRLALPRRGQLTHFRVLRLRTPIRSCCWTPLTDVTLTACRTSSRWLQHLWTGKKKLYAFRRRPFTSLTTDTKRSRNKT